MDKARQTVDRPTSQPEVQTDKNQWRGMQETQDIQLSIEACYRHSSGSFVSALLWLPRITTLASKSELYMAVNEDEAGGLRVRTRKRAGGEGGKTVFAKKKQCNADVEP